MSVLVIICASAVLGSLLLRPLALGDSPESWGFRLYAGLSLCGITAIALGGFSLYLAYAVLVLVAAAGATAEVLVLARRRPHSAWTLRRPSNTPVENMACAACGIALALALLSALAPVTAWDAAVAHLALPADYARDGRIALQPGNVYSGYPHFMHALYALAYYGGGERQVALLNWVLAALSASSVYGLGRRIGGRDTGLVTAAFYTTAPIFMDQAGAVSIDLPFVGFTLAALSALHAAYERRQYRWILLAGILAGSACGIRHTGFLVCLLLAVFVLLSRVPRRFHAMGLFLGAATVFAAPWLFRSALIAGNPFFPFFSEWFPITAIAHVDVTGLGLHESAAAMQSAPWRDLFLFPWDILMRPGEFDGWSKSPGGMLIPFAPAGLVLGGIAARLLGIYSLSGILLFYFFQRFARYLLPFFAALMPVAALGALRLRMFRRGLRALVIFSFGYGLLLGVAAMHFKLPVVFGFETREEYLERRVERYAAFAFMNAQLPGGAVFSPDQRSYYIDAPVFQNHWAMKQLAGFPYRQQLAWLAANKIRYVFMPFTFLDESPAIRDDMLLLFNRWRNDARHFKRIETPVFPQARGTGIERIEIYEFVAPANEQGQP